jgi:hypothetical protein
MGNRLTLLVIWNKEKMQKKPSPNGGRLWVAKHPTLQGYINHSRVDKSKCASGTVEIVYPTNVGYLSTPVGAALSRPQHRITLVITKRLKK